MQRHQKSVLNKIESPATFPGERGGAGPTRLGTTACAGRVFSRRRYSGHPVKIFWDIEHGASEKNST